MSLKGCNIFVTGGIGFIASHTVLVLLEHGAKVTLIDNLSNSFMRVFDHMKKLAGDKADLMKFVKCDINDYDLLTKLFKEDKFDCVIHFAGYKAVGESVEKPLEYYYNNFQGTITLLRVMREQGCKNMVFSSSCTVYGMPEKVPITEDTPLKAISPYGRTKLFQEDMFRDLAVSDPAWRILLLRYFNPIGAHPSGELGEHPVGIPNNLMPYIQQVALGQRDFLRVWGNDYPTPDGTAIRDYIHVMDLAEGHVAAVVKVLKTPELHCKEINLGTGKGSSVLEMVSAFEKASGKKVEHKIMERRAGDSTAVWAATDLAEKELGWKAKYNVDDMCKHQWQWATKYPQGYDTPM
uniref:UDP-glucose 4-epimerase n=1 Tax=Chlamydomonas leiostraca TaxID=1034604 RepID=A0A7S0S0J6_9CHLO|eukprot:CAMPEP_0202858974 /NCGR_PEP_ID=MMETSP1391-20130828/1283_1 /ASSEMBLY_ACC=CAM_ASM_000867 /TAXON_ID=1034604 /ORGANISM="Chlamydomonas leiostraca, Strain SAG 11-49" /LENGTH=349 /DNA_ID=CAMNT_0049537963 /DNA_START=61 /DNA_END=1110 /DNA_ORIENTATION=+